MASAERQVAVVTGAGSGIGRATALALDARGLDVVCVGRRTAPLEETAEQFTDGRGCAVAADVSTAEGIRSIIAAVGGAPSTPSYTRRRRGNRVAGRDHQARLRPVVAVNLAGPFFLTQALRPLLADGSGIVFVGSVSALHGRPRHAAYAATKAALLGLTTSLAAELAPRVRVNCVCPGATDTPMMAGAITDYLQGMDDQEAQRTATAEMTRVLLGRIAAPAELAAAIVHLALDASSAPAALSPLTEASAPGYRASLTRGHHDPSRFLGGRLGPSF